MGRKKRYNPKPFESTGISSDTSANIYNSMFLHDAFLSLTKNQRLLYICMKDRYYSARERPAKDFEELGMYQGMEYFYFNLAIAEKYNLYKRSNRKSLYDDIAELEKHGLIKTMSNGKGNHRKSIYCFSDMWKDFRSVV